MVDRGLASVSRGLTVVVAILAILAAVWPEHAPVAALAAAGLALVPLHWAWRGARGTALRAAVAWGFVAVALAIVSQGVGIGEPLNSGRPVAGHWAYLSVLAALAASISVLNARQPGGGAWAILMALLLLVFLIPWLEGPGLGGRGVSDLGRLRLENPWTIFYGLLVLAGVTNYLPTRFGHAAALLGVAFAAEFAGLTRMVSTPSALGALWSWVVLILALGGCSAGLRSTRTQSSAGRFEATWFWFRDRWGVVWALRILERFNRSAEAQGWPYRLTWHGLTSTEPGAVGRPVPSEAAEATLRMLLRRFAEPSRLEQAADDGDD